MTQESQMLPFSTLRSRARAFLLAAAIIVGDWAGAFAEYGQLAINLPNEIGTRIAQCWQAPQMDPPQVVEVTVRLSFSRTGAVIGAPRVVYVRPAKAGIREEIVTSALAAIKACTPLPFTPSLGAAIAGRMLAIRLQSLPVTGRPRFTNHMQPRSKRTGLPSILTSRRASIFARATCRNPVL